MYYKLSQIQRLDRKLLALGKNSPQTGNKQFMQNNERGHFDFIAAIDTRYKHHENIFEWNSSSDSLWC